MEIIVSDRVRLNTAEGVHRCDSRRVDMQGPWSCMMTFQDSGTYNWYLKDIPRDFVDILDASELPDKAEEVKFWWAWREGAVRHFYAIGKVVIGSDFEQPV